MIPPKSLALYKNRPALVLESHERLEIRLEDGTLVKVREKDIEALHDGPLASLPPPTPGGDFETARAMADAGARLSWADIAELVFGTAGPGEILACWKEGLEAMRFRQVEGGLVPMSDGEIAKENEKRARKEGEAAERAAFVDRAKKARGRKPDAEAAFLPADERFLAEIEAFALGKSQKCKLLSETGIGESPEGAHAFLLKSGRWTDMLNPYPSRCGCTLGAPKKNLGPDYQGLARIDLCGMDSWAIDNAWSHDPDDAVAFHDGHVYVHVADPAAAIRPGDPADREALARGTTLYIPESTSPMLADEALERFGLGLSETSPALSFKIKVGQDGAIDDVEVMASTVRVRRSHYAEADTILDSGGSGALAELARIAALRQGRRVSQGAVEIDIPEVRVFVRDGDIRIETLPRTRSSGMVRELMLLAGEAVARWAFERKLPFPFYSQESPSEGGETANGTGLSAQFARRRLMRGGITGPSPGAHRGLGLPFYAQATSPLRRYQDLLGHMQVRAFLEGRDALPADEVMRHCAEAQAAASGTRSAERQSEQHWTLAWLRRQAQWRGPGIVVGQGGGGASHVYIPALGLETRLRLGNGRQLEETVQLRLSRVDLPTLEVSFEEEI